MYRTLKGTNWKKAAALVSFSCFVLICVSLHPSPLFTSPSSLPSQTALFYPTIVFGTSFLVNFFIWGKHSSGAVSYSSGVRLSRYSAPFIYFIFEIRCHSQLCWLSSACGSGYPSLLSSVAFILDFASSLMSTQFAPIRFHARYLTSFGICTPCSGDEGEDSAVGVALLLLFPIQLFDCRNPSIWGCVCRALLYFHCKPCKWLCTINEKALMGVN